MSLRPNAGTPLPTGSPTADARPIMPQSVGPGRRVFDGLLQHDRPRSVDSDRSIARAAFQSAVWLYGLMF